MHISARWFVFLVFAVLGASFIATTGLLMWEFRAHEWLALMTMDSHLFVFFPTLGIVALFAFYLPACAFVDLYWFHMGRSGPWRFLAGVLIVATLSWGISRLLLDTPNRPIFEIAPAVLAADRGAPFGCATGQVECTRLPILDSIRGLRMVSTQRIGLGKLLRDCERDPLIEPSQEQSLKRICLAKTRYSAHPVLDDDATCCAAQRAHVEAIRDLHANATDRSLTGLWHARLLPLKIFFLLILLSMSGMLAFWSERVSQRYRAKLFEIEVGILIGIVAVLFLPLMSQAFLQSYRVLAGAAGKGYFSAIVPAITVAVVLWAALLVFFFFRNNRDRELQTLGRFAGFGAGAFALIKIDEVISVLVRVLGSGASITSLVLLLAFSFILIFIMASTTLTGALSPAEMARESAAARRQAGDPLPHDDDGELLDPPHDLVEPPPVRRGTLPQSSTPSHG